MSSFWWSGTQIGRNRYLYAVPT